MKLSQAEIRQTHKGLHNLVRQYEKSGRAVLAEDMKAARSAEKKFKELVK